jgi:Domain of unknown function (DUF4333)
VRGGHVGGARRRAARHLLGLRQPALVTVLRAGAVLTALAAAAAVAGCGGNSLDTRRVEARLRVGITHRGIDVKSVQCPRKVDAKQGETFTCTATDRAGTSEKVTVRQLDGRGTVSCSTVVLQGNLCRA